MAAQPPHMLIRELPPHRQLRAFTLAPDGTILSDNSRPNGELTVGDIRHIIRAFERAYQALGEMSIKD
jgi:hypothetical protein